MNGFAKMRVNGTPSPAELAKGAALVSDGVGPHDHGDGNLHEQAFLSLSDEEVEYLASRGLYTNRHHGIVTSANGAPVPATNVGAMLSEARRKGLLPEGHSRRQGPRH